jgi:hypothetical protein
MLSLIELFAPVVRPRVNEFYAAPTPHFVKRFGCRVTNCCIRKRAAKMLVVMFGGPAFY